MQGPPRIFLWSLGFSCLLSAYLKSPFREIKGISFLSLVSLSLAPSQKCCNLVYFTFIYLFFHLFIVFWRHGLAT